VNRLPQPNQVQFSLETRSSVLGQRSFDAFEGVSRESKDACKYVTAEAPEATAEAFREAYSALLLCGDVRVAHYACEGFVEAESEFLAWCVSGR